MTNKKTQLLCLWSGPVAILLFLVGMGPLAGLLPPPSPNMTAVEVQELYQDNTDLKRIGFVVIMIAGAMTGPWAAAVATQMKRIEGQHSPLTYTQLGLGMINILLFVFPVLVMQVAAFRPDRDPEFLLLIQDLAWLPFVGAFATPLFQCLAIAVVCFRDPEAKVFPRWLGYLNLWVAFLMLPAALIYFFKTGPFAWNGAFCFWLPLGCYALWFAVMTVMCRKAILRQADEEQASPAAQTAAEARVPVPA